MFVIIHIFRVVITFPIFIVNPIQDGHFWGTHFGQVTKNEKLLNILLGIIETKQELPDHPFIYRLSCKKVYPTLKVNIQHFLSTKLIKNKQIYHLNECNFDNLHVQKTIKIIKNLILIINWLFSIMTFLGEIIQLYLQ